MSEGPTVDVDRPRAIVAAHGDLAAGLVDAVICIIGRDDLFIPLTNRDLSRETLESTLRVLIDQTRAAVIFTDLPAGSWTIAARRVQRDHPALVVVTGASLPVLLDYACSGESGAGAARQAAERGRQALLVCEPPAARREPS